MPDLIFNLLMLGVDAVALALVRRYRGWLGVLAGGALAAGCCGPLALFYTVLIGWNPVFATMRFCAWGVFLHGPLLLFGGAVVLRRRRGWRLGLPVAGLAVLAVAAEAFVQEPSELGLSRFTVETAKLDRPLRIGVIADLQTDAPGPHERHALELLLAEEPDLVLFAGDYVHELQRDERQRDWTALNAMLREVGLQAPLGVYAVQGDVDSVGWHRVFEGIDAELFDETRSIDRVLPGDGTNGTKGMGGTGESLRITGLSYRDGQDHHLRLQGTDGFHVVLSHRPDFALGTIDADLLVAGHTHGGQVKIPFLGAPILLSRIPRAWGDGLTELPGGRTLVVSRGIGMERGQAPRLRFLCPPEVVVIDVLPASGR